jgi:mRNA interferase RelE/StbE
MGFYKIIVKKSVEKDIRRLDKKEIPKVTAAIQQLAVNPFPASSKKLVGSENTYRLRIGDNRILYIVDNDLVEISVERVRHRKDVYE